MEEKELIEKLSRVSRINIETPSYRVRLRIALLEAHDNIRKPQRITAFAWKFFPVSALALMLLVLGLSREPSLSLNNINTPSEVKQILQADRQTKPLIASGAIIGDTEILGNRAYALMQLPEIITPNLPILSETAVSAPMLNAKSDYLQQGLPSTGGGIYLVEINLTDGKVIRVEKKLEQQTIIGSGDQQAVNEIIGQRGEQVNRLSAETTVDRIEIIRPDLKLIKTDGQFDLMPGSDQAKDIYLILKQGEEEWKEKVKTVPDK